MPTPKVISIAGLDPSGGAGVLADVGVLAAFDCAPAAAITAITFQNDQAVFGVEPLSPKTIRDQVLAVIEGNEVLGVKVGMLPTAESVSVVAQLCCEGKLPPPIVDPVMRSSSGFALVDDDAIDTLIRELIPLARLVTPNIFEAERLSGLRIGDIDGMQAAAAAIRSLGIEAVLVKGGHLEGNTHEAVDVLDENGKVTILRGDRVTARLRGTGCRLSSAITALLTKGNSLSEAVTEAKQFVANQLREAAAFA
jgi:hydroxymethylpyrimidine/phosphomethylpyrimidine kinase